MSTQELRTGMRSRRVLLRRALVGAAIGLGIISLFVFSADNPDPAWGTYWRVRPLVVVPLAGAAGGAFYHLMIGFSKDRGAVKYLFFAISAVVFVIGLWLGIVIGLDGTLWN